MEKKSLRKFLESKGILDDYIKEFDVNYAYYPICNVIDRCEVLAIDGCFDWFESEKGFDFWRDVYSDWVEYLDQDANTTAELEDGTKVDCSSSVKTKIAVVEGGKAPIISTEGSGGIDMFARTKECVNYGHNSGSLREESESIYGCVSEDLHYPPKYKYNLGCKFEIPKGYIGLVNMRSSSAKIEVRLSNGLGYIDSDYRGEVVAFVSGADADKFEVGDKMCQMIVVPCLTDFEIVDESELSKTERGSKGYGSTGK